MTNTPRRERLRSIESAAIAGVVYAVLTLISLMFTTSTLVLRTGVMPRWLAHIGYATGVVLFPLVYHPLGIVFPLWVLVVSITIGLTRPQHES